MPPCIRGFSGQAILQRHVNIFLSRKKNNSIPIKEVIASHAHTWTDLWVLVRNELSTPGAFNFLGREQADGVGGTIAGGLWTHCDNWSSPKLSGPVELVPHPCLASCFHGIFGEI